MVAELAAEVVQVIATAAQNPESVPEPDQAVAFLKRLFSPAAEAAPLLQAPGTQTVETDAAARAINASGIAETAIVQMAGPPVGISQNPAALLLPNATEEGETGKTRAAAEKAAPAQSAAKGHPLSEPWAAAVRRPLQASAKRGIHIQCSCHACCAKPFSADRGQSPSGKCC